MANSILNAQSEHILNSAKHRNLPDEFVGNAHLDHVLQNHRLRGFLLRNIAQSRKFQQQRLLRQTQPAAATEQTNVIPANSTNAHMNSDPTASDGTVQVSSLIRPVTSHQETIPEHDTSVPAFEAMSSQTVLRKHKDDQYDSKRKSLRTLMQKQHEDPDSSLIIKINNIRKKLNWKDSKPTRELPPRKKPRLEPVECDAYLSIWDNSGPTTSKMPLLSKREFCELVKIKRDADPVKGEFIEVRLDEPLIISQKELRVATKTGNHRMALATQYFMEIKIVPRDEKIVWPPIPLLGKSDGDRFNGMGTDAKDEINTSMIARYQHLPAAPDADTPLSIFVYAEGRTFRTKYGLEVSAKWVPKDHPDLVRKPPLEPELEPWALDDGKHPFGRVDPTRKPVSQAARKTAPTNRKPTARVVRLPKITYNIHVTKGGKNGFNKCSVRGLKCYSCSGKSFESLNELRFHLDQNHKNRVTIESEELDPVDSKLIAATITIETPSNQRLRAIQGDHDDDADKIFSYVAPHVPFDLDVHYTNKNTPWTKVLPAQLSKEAAKGSLMAPKANDFQSKIRRDNKGHVPYQKVLPFRPQEYQRKKFPNKKLLTKHVSLEHPYTSISHRPVCVDDDEAARSETDDEIDDSWFVDRHLEELDLRSWQENWSDARRRLAKKWDWHVLHRERGISAKYIGDSLIRFVRIEKKWILREDIQLNDPAAGSQAQLESFTALVEMMEELKTMKVINENVCADVITMLYSGEELEVPVEEQKEMEAQAEDVSKRNQKIRQQKMSTKGRTVTSLDLSPNICVRCRLPIGHDRQRAVRCCTIKCSTPNAWYHAKCAGLQIAGGRLTQGFGSTQAVVVNDFMIRRSTWKCDGCKKVTRTGNVIPQVSRETHIDPSVNEEPILNSPGTENRVSETVENTGPRYKSASVVPSREPSLTAKPPLTNSHTISESKDMVSTIYIWNRACLNGIVAHHYHDENNCFYKIIDTRPNRSRSNKQNPVLAICKEYKITPNGQTKHVFVRFPDKKRKQNSENWQIADRDFEAEVITRFRPFKVQHYFDVKLCKSRDYLFGLKKPLQLSENEYTATAGFAGRLSKSDKVQGRNFFDTELKGTWFGDYFKELEKISREDRAAICEKPMHHECAHSITLGGPKYATLAKVTFMPWTE